MLPLHQFVVDRRTDKAIYGLVEAVAPNGVLKSKMDALKRINGTKRMTHNSPFPFWESA